MCLCKTINFLTHIMFCELVLIVIHLSWSFSLKSKNENMTFHKIKLVCILI